MRERREKERSEKNNSCHPDENEENLKTIDDRSNEESGEKPSTFAAAW